MATEDVSTKATPLTELGYETQDLQPKLLIQAGIFFFIFAVLSTAIAAVFMRLPGIVPEYPAPTKPFQNIQPPAGTPVLQNNITNTTDIRDLRQNEMRELSTYGLGDASTPVGATYHIPNDDAINIVATQGFDTTQTWLARSSNAVPGELTSTKAGPNSHTPVAPTALPTTIPVNGAVTPNQRLSPVARPKILPKTKQKTTSTSGSTQSAKPKPGAKL